MADFSFLSDSDDAAVEEILSEAADHVALKQISSINLSGVSDSVLPQNLESRFRRLKTFPSAALPTPKSTDSTPNQSNFTSGSPEVKPAPVEKKSPTGSESSYSWLESKNSSESAQRSRSISPPTKNAGCLWCSPKKAVKKMSFSKRRSGGGGSGGGGSGGGSGGSGGGGGLDWGRNDGVLKDLGVGSLSRMEQEKILKRAAKEEMKINREAEKIVKLAHQVSARMEAFGLEIDDHLHCK